MAAVDRAMVEVCGLDLMQVMEVAGRAVAIEARVLADVHAPLRGPIAVLCGSGGNGGDALVCARYLAGWHWETEIWLLRPSHEYRGLIAHQLSICRKLGLVIHEPNESMDDRLPLARMFVDGLFGFGLNAPVTGRAAEMIRYANAAEAPMIAIDIPSGIHATTGEVLGVAIEAVETVTLALPKWGLVRGVGPKHAGHVEVADIGVPPAAYIAAGIPLTPLFWDQEFIDLEDRELLPAPE
jgi:NAD(P)H-hydrate epimerase